MWVWRGNDIWPHVGPMWSHHVGSTLIPRAKLRWADVDCRRWAHGVNVNSQHCVHVVPTYQCYLGKLRWAWPKTRHQAPTLYSIDKSLSRNSHSVWGVTRQPAIKEESKVVIDQPWLGWPPSMQSVAIHKCYNQSFYNENCTEKLLAPTVFL